MAFKTKLDFSSNRQVKQHEKTITALSGGTSFGLPYSAMTSGPDLSTSAVTQTIVSITGYTSTFSGNNTTTQYNWFDARMSLGESTLSAITSTTSAATQVVSGVYTANTNTTIDGNLVNLTYSGVSYNVNPLTVIDLGGGNYTGTVRTYQLDILSASTLDYTGRTIWNDVSGITRTQRLIISDMPVSGYVWTCIDTEGMGEWQYNGSSSGSTIWTAGTGTSSAVLGGSDGIASAVYSVAEGYLTVASGNSAHAEGYLTIAGGSNSHAEGQSTKALASDSHAEGTVTTANGMSSHAEGAYTTANASASHAEGNSTFAGGINSHAEGTNTTASGLGSHAEGNQTSAGGNYSHAEGSGTFANANYSHAEGSGTTAGNTFAHVEGYGSMASGSATHAEGYFSRATSDGAHAEGGAYGAFTGGTASSNGAHAEGVMTLASNWATHAEGYLTQATGSNGSHAEGYGSTASGAASHAEGTYTIASGDTAHAEGGQTIAGGTKSHAEGQSTKAYGDYSHAEGVGSIASGDTSHAEGSNTIASGIVSHAEGTGTTASGNYSHAEGTNTIASGTTSHAQGNNTIAGGMWSHAEGSNTIASGIGSHAEGGSTIASGIFSHAQNNGNSATGNYSHAEGSVTLASGQMSHAEGFGTTASGAYSHAGGGSGSVASGLQSFVHGRNSSATNTNTIVFGEGITGTSANSVYVPNMIINTGGTRSVLGINTSSPEYVIDVNGNNARVYLGDTYTGSDAPFKNFVLSADSTNLPQIAAATNSYLGGYGLSLQMGVLGDNITSTSNSALLGTSGDTYLSSSQKTNNLNIINRSGGSGTNHIRMYAGVNSVSAASEPDFQIQGYDTLPIGSNRGYIGIKTGDPQYLIDARGHLNNRLLYDTTFASDSGTLTMSATTGLPTIGVGTNTGVVNQNGGISIGMRAWNDSAWATYGNPGDTHVYSSKQANGLVIISSDGVGTEDYIECYVGGDADGSGELAIHMHGTGATKGYVGFDTNLPTQRLDVNGNGRFRIIGSTASAGALHYTADGTLTSNTSDERLKTNITTLTGALDKVNQLRGVTYNWTENPTGDTRIGFIAQEVNAVVPELTFTNPNSPELYMGVHYDNVTALLVEAVKELSSGVTTSNNTHLETQTILAEDNNIELNYSGTPETAIGGGIRILHALGADNAAELITDIDGNFVTNNDLKPQALTIPLYTPTSSNDSTGSEGNITRDDNYMYVKTSTGWKRTNLESF